MNKTKILVVTHKDFDDSYISKCREYQIIKVGNTFILYLIITNSYL